jgi:hypothetical protein
MPTKAGTKNEKLVLVPYQTPVPPAKLEQIHWDGDKPVLLESEPE